MAKQKQTSPAIRTIELSPRERDLLRAVLANYCLRLGDAEQEGSSTVNTSMHLQQTAQRADKLLGKFDEAPEDFVGVWEVEMAHWREDR